MLRPPPCMLAVLRSRELSGSLELMVVCCQKRWSDLLQCWAAAPLLAGGEVSSPASQLSFPSIRGVAWHIRFTPAQENHEPKPLKTAQKAITVHVLGIQDHFFPCAKANSAKSRGWRLCTETTAEAVAKNPAGLHELAASTIGGPFCRCPYTESPILFGVYKVGSLISGTSHFRNHVIWCVCIYIYIRILWRITLL